MKYFCSLLVAPSAAVIAREVARAATCVDIVASTLPAVSIEGDWNGKLQGAGHGGVAGRVAEASLVSALARGDAGVSAKLGHDGKAIGSSFAIGHPALMSDWAMAPPS